MRYFESLFSNPYFASVMPWLIGLFVLCIVAIIWLAWYSSKKRKEIRESIFGGHFISVEEFEKNWMIGGTRGKQGMTGYKYEDGPGCYVILIFDHPVTDDNFTSYDNVYIGQSVNVCQRVHSHFTGKGNGDVYADVRNGKYVYVQFRRCEKEEMNSLEKSLIDAFSATDSYNNTRGGGTRR